MFACRVQPLDKDLEWTDEVRTPVNPLVGLDMFEPKSVSGKLFEQDNYCTEGEARRISKRVVLMLC